MINKSYVKLGDIFDVYNGIASSYVKIVNNRINDSHIPYIRPTSNYLNSIAGYIDKRAINNKFIFPEDTIFVSTDGQGSHTYSYVSTFEFIPNSNVSVLVPKVDMSIQEKMYYSMCITKNRYRFSYGRKPKGNRLLSLLLPNKEDMPVWVNKISTDNILNTTSIIDSQLDLCSHEWRSFEINNLFNVIKSKNVPKENLKYGSTPFISAITGHNGVSKYIINDTLENGNTFTVASTGAGGVGTTFYQDSPYCASNSINILTPKFHSNRYNGLFISVIMNKEKYKFSYGRIANIERLKKATIKLPVNHSGEPDFVFMENYVKSLPYSASLWPFNV